jgi:hypothetical protein
MKRRLAGLLALGAMTLILVGCSSDPVGRTVPVKGKVTVGGQPLKQGSVTFWPNESKGNKSTMEAGASVNEDGTYQLFTKGKAGAPPGPYKVTVAAQTQVDSTKPMQAKSLVPSSYNTRESTPLLIDVVENPAPGAYDLTVK